MVIISSETQKWLDTMVQVGFAAEKWGRGLAWHQTYTPDGELPANAHADDIPFGVVANLFDRHTPAEAPLQMVLPNGAIIDVPGKKAIYNTEDQSLFGIFGDGYTIHPFREALLDQVAAITGDQLKIGSAGLLEGGATGWIQVETPESVTFDDLGESIRPSILAAASHNGKIGLRYSLVMTRTVCDNTLASALKERIKYISFRHSKYSNNKTSAIAEALGIMEQSLNSFEAELRDMIATPVTAKQFSKFLDIHTPLKDDKGEDKTGTALTFAEREREAISGLYQGDPRVAPWSGTSWGVLQAVNTYEQHAAIVRKVSRTERQWASTISGKTFDQDRLTITQLNMVLKNASAKQALVGLSK